MGPEFYQTPMGHKFFEGTMPAIRNNIKELQETVAELTKTVEALTKTIATTVNASDESPCLLISVIEGDISTEKFDSLDKAQAELRARYEDACHGGCVEEFECDGLAHYTEVPGEEAWVTDGCNHDDYSWKIILL